MPATPIAAACFGSTLPGSTVMADFRLVSTLAADVGGVLSCDAPGLPFNVDNMPAFPMVPVGASIDAQTSVTCTPGTPPGEYAVSFQLREIGGPAIYAATDVPVRVTCSPWPEPWKRCPG